MDNRNTFLVAIPNSSIINKVFELRKKVVELGYGSSDPRGNVLPHITITYIENEVLSKNQIKTIRNSLSEITFEKPITLSVKEYLCWEHKIVASFDTQPIKELVLKSQALFQEMGIKVNENYQKLYGDTVGDHMKIIRHILPENAQKAIELVKSEFPERITIDRIAFIGYECEEKDILWQKSPIKATV